MLNSQWFGELLDAVDGFFAGWAHSLTGSLSTRLRALAWGDAATRNHSGFWFELGSAVGTVHSMALMGVNPCALGSVGGAALRAINGLAAAGSGLSAYENFAAGNYLMGTLDALGALGNVANIFRACFVGGTPLLTPDGPRPIEDLKPGDLVLARGEFDPVGEVRPRRVLAAFRRVAPIINLHAGGRVIGTTGEHPFWVEGAGWVKAQDLRIGDVLLSHDGARVPVEGVADSGRYETVYNVSVEADQTYFVGGEGWGWSVWAHNKCFDYGLSGRDGLATAIGRTRSLSEAKQLVSDYRALIQLTSRTETIFKQAGMTYLKQGELAFIKANPWSRLMFEGTARDRILKQLLAQEQAAGRLLNLSITRQGQTGIDLFQGTRFGFDLTTSKAWAKHVKTYQNNYDILLPLLYR